MSTESRVIIVGAGPAGLAAAEVLAEKGIKTLLLDENRQPGGQLLRFAPPAAGRESLYRNSVGRKGRSLLACLQSSTIDVLTSAQVIGFEAPDRLWVDAGTGGVRELRFEALLLATGAREKFLSFPGWTLPGVISSGGAQLLIKGSGVLPAPEMVIGGCGVLPLALAGEVLKNKGRVQAVLDESALADSLGLLRLLPRQLPRVLQGGLGLGRLLLAGRRVRHRTRIVQARGDKRLEEVVTAGIDARGRVVPGTEREIETGSLAMGYGFAPNIELAREVGCDLLFTPDKGGWAVRVDECQQSSQALVFAAGEPTGVAGGNKAALEGAIAGLSIVSRLKGRPGRQERRNLEVLQAGLQKELRFGAFLNRLTRIPEAGYRVIPPETVVCRCEQVRQAEILKAIGRGLNTVPGVKKATRCGMGICQGRTCGPILTEILRVHPDLPDAEPALFSVRPPLKPVSVGDLAEADV
ncbi:MAG: NAD(P)/FAD-dependent oxidoreductase [Desulfohalobiaceae bacterium]|nr:NAD(P)/FAD-dependent oxidoreductase [Desulfohalobiaceae bacterium]